MTAITETAAQKALRLGWLPLVLVVGLAARFWVSGFGHNYDFDSYRIVVGVVEDGKNVYANTPRYNYGPIWFQILHLLDALAGHRVEMFRGLLIGFLSAVDVGIFYVLWRKFGRVAATLFFLNPVSVMITGFHNQFDNSAVLLGLGAVLLFGDDFERPVGGRKFLGLVTLGLSLMTKHVLFAFPLWLAVKQKGLAQKVLVLLVPVVVFLAGFIPYWQQGHTGIITNVFEYKSNPTAYIYRLIAPTLVQSLLSARDFWLLMLALFAIIHRKKPVVESLLVYLAVMVATAPATTNEYLAIPVAFTAVVVNVFTVAYTVIATCHVSGDVNGPPLLSHDTGGTDDLALYALGLALIWGTWRENILDFLKKCRDEINIQLGRGE